MAKFPNHFTSHSAPWLDQLPKIILPAPLLLPAAALICCRGPSALVSSCKNGPAVTAALPDGTADNDAPLPPQPPCPTTSHPPKSSGKANSQMFCFCLRRRLLRTFVWLMNCRKTEARNIPPSIQTVSWMRMQMLF